MTKPLASARHELLLLCFFSGWGESRLCSHNSLVLLCCRLQTQEFTLKAWHHFSNKYGFFPPILFPFSFLFRVEKQEGQAENLSKISTCAVTWGERASTMPSRKQPRGGSQSKLSRVASTGNPADELLCSQPQLVGKLWEEAIEAQPRAKGWRTSGWRTRLEKTEMSQPLRSGVQPVYVSIFRPKNFSKPGSTRAHPPFSPPSAPVGDKPTQHLPKNRKLHPLHIFNTCLFLWFFIFV